MLNSDVAEILNKYFDVVDNISEFPRGLPNSLDSVDDKEIVSFNVEVGDVKFGGFQ